jgi:hypothetical protein
MTPLKPSMKLQTQDMAVNLCNSYLFVSREIHGEDSVVLIAVLILKTESISLLQFVEGKEEDIFDSAENGIGDSEGIQSVDEVLGVLRMMRIITHTFSL